MLPKAFGSILPTFVNQSTEVRTRLLSNRQKALKRTFQLRLNASISNVPHKVSGSPVGSWVSRGLLSVFNTKLEVCEPRQIHSAKTVNKSWRSLVRASHCNSRVYLPRGSHTASYALGPQHLHLCPPFQTSLFTPRQGSGSSAGRLV